MNITGNLDIFENPYGAPRPTESPNPSATKKIQKPRKPRNIPKSNVLSPKVNVLSRKVNVKYFWGIFEEFNVFEISCWGVTVTGVSKIPNRKRLISSMLNVIVFSFLGAFLCMSDKYPGTTTANPMFQGFG